MKKSVLRETPYRTPETPLGDIVKLAEKMPKPPPVVRFKKWWKEFKLPRPWSHPTFWPCLGPVPFALALCYGCHWDRIANAVAGGLVGTWMLIVINCWVADQSK